MTTFLGSILILSGLAAMAAAYPSERENMLDEMIKELAHKKFLSKLEEMAMMQQESTQCSLSAPPDGTILLEHDDLWQIGTYTCNEGYKLVGEPVRFCIDGIWNGTEPECVKPCLDTLYIMAFTSGKRHGGSDEHQGVEISANGETKSTRLPNLPGDDYYKEKGDLWEIPISDFSFSSSCMEISDISNLAIVAMNDDGWHIESVATFASDIAGNDTPLSLDLHADRWIDVDNNHPDHARFDLSLLNTV